MLSTVSKLVKCVRKYDLGGLPLSLIVWQYLLDQDQIQLKFSKHYFLRLHVGLWVHNNSKIFMNFLFWLINFFIPSISIVKSQTHNLLLIKEWFFLVCVIHVYIGKLGIQHFQMRFTHKYTFGINVLFNIILSNL